MVVPKNICIFNRWQPAVMRTPNIKRIQWYDTPDGKLCSDWVVKDLPKEWLVHKNPAS
jgi:hypothetical protein